MLHQANAYEEGDELVVWSSGWGPEQLAGRQLRISNFGDNSALPYTLLWEHR